MQIPDFVQPHHRRSIERLTEHFAADPKYLALLVGGSIAKGLARPDSDIDIVLVATEAEFQRRAAANEYWYSSRDFTDYPGGYVDGKVLNLQFLHDVAAHGSEPARSAFEGAIVGFSRVKDLSGLLARITTYPEAEREQKLRRFVGHMRLLTWYVGEAVKREDSYLLRKMTADLALYACRVVLAYNRILYPYHKWLMQRVQAAPERPAGFLEAVEALLASPGVESARALCGCVDRWQDWGVTLEEAVVGFMEESEWNWRSGPAPLADR